MLENASLAYLRTALPVDDADHAVLTVVRAVDTQLVQQVQQQHAEVTVKLADGGFEACVRLVDVRMLEKLRENTEVFCGAFRRLICSVARIFPGFVDDLSVPRYISKYISWMGKGYLSGRFLPLCTLCRLSLIRRTICLPLLHRETL